MFQATSSLYFDNLYKNINIEIIIHPTPRNTKQ